MNGLYIILDDHIRLIILDDRDYICVTFVLLSVHCTALTLHCPLAQLLAELLAESSRTGRYLVDAMDCCALHVFIIVFFHVKRISMIGFSDEIDIPLELFMFCNAIFK